MIVIDTSLLIPIFADTTGEKRRVLKRVLKGRDYALTRITELELLQGARDDAEWGELQRYLAVQTYVEAEPATWRDGARLYFELRRKGKTIRSVLDCVISQICIDARRTLLHNDRDFEVISSLSGLRQLRVQF